MPAPPPPPPMAPAAPPQPAFSLAKSNPDDRGALLKSIRQGAKLKKTVTVDKSAPMISGKVSSSTGNNNGSTSSNGSSSYSGTVPSNGLGGLFAGGMPKLKPTGILGTTNYSTKPTNNNDDLIPSHATPSRNFSSIQLELKKQLANDNRNRGPPPPAPNRTMSGDPSRQPFSPKENVSNGLHLSQLSLNANSSSLHSNSSTLHRKTKSNANLSTLDSTDDVNNGFVPTRPVISHGKPNLAPKPPALNGKPAPPQIKSGKPISRAHSMRTPRSPSPQSPEGNPANKFGTVRHMSSLLSQSLSNSGHSQRLRTPLNSRPSAPPPSVPAQHPLNLWSPQSQVPPPPPSKTASVKHPNHAPPPPPAPNHAPPPPPHKTQPVRQPPLVPANNNTNPPPPPPPRNSSMRDTPTTKRMIIDLDEKFKNCFQSPEKFPHPPPYKNILKIYSYKQTVHIKPGV